jgi:hypothetical protein
MACKKFQNWNSGINTKLIEGEFLDIQRNDTQLTGKVFFTSVTSGRIRITSCRIRITSGLIRIASGRIGINKRPYPH